MKNKKLIIIIIPTVILAIISIITTIEYVRYINDNSIMDVSMLYSVYKLAPVIVTIILTIGLFLKNRYVISISALLIFFIHIMPIFLMSLYENNINSIDISINLYNVAIAIFTLSFAIVSIASFVRFDKGIKSISFIIIIAVNSIAILLGLVGVFTNIEESNVLAGFITILYGLAIISIYYYLVSLDENIQNQRKVENNYSIWKKINAGIIICTLILGIISIIFFINKISDDNRYTYLDEEIKYIESKIPVESDKIRTLLEELQLDGEYFFLPYNIQKLPNEFSVEKTLTGELKYDVDGLLQYNGENVAFVQNIPSSESYIYSIYVTKDNIYADKITISGISIGSTKEELLSTFQNFDNTGVLENGEEFFMYIGEETLEYIRFNCFNNKVVSIDIGDYSLVFY